MTVQEFEISNATIVFAPLIYPKKVVVRKERRKSRQPGYCEGEDVADIGSKNREIDLSGVILAYEKPAIDALLDSSGNLDLVADEWSGEVQILDGEYERIAPETYSYRLTLVSTGLDEDGGSRNSGILDAGVAGYDLDYIDNLILSGELK